MRSSVEVSMKSRKRAVIPEITCAAAVVGENQTNGLSKLIVFFNRDVCPVKRGAVIITQV
jgi:hypothetical protein